ncbi:DUF7504 family protein [Haloarcula amylovorans]
MASNGGPQFTFPPDLEPETVQPGTNILVSGSSGQGARDVALRLMLAGTSSNEGVLLLSADTSGRTLLERAAHEVETLDRDRVGIVDCSGLEDDQQRFDEHEKSIDDPGDLTAIQMELSVLYETLLERGYDRVRVGVFSVSALIAHAELEAVSRFIHMLSGRVIATDDLGVFVLDSSMQDDLTVDVIEQYCDGTIDVQMTDDDNTEVRARGLGIESPSWRQVSARPQDQQQHQP